MLHYLSHRYAKCVRLFSIFLILPLVLFSAGCGGSSSDPGPVTGGPNPPAVSITPEAAQRFLVKATFGPRKADIDHLVAIGYEAWLDEQLAMPQTELLPYNDLAVADREANRRLLLIQQGESDPDVLNRGIGKGQEHVSRVDSWWHGVMNGPDQLRQRMAFALGQILVVGDQAGDSSFANRAYSGYNDVLINHAFDNYRELFEAVTLNPVMGGWLSFRGNIKQGHPAQPGLPDENFAREAMQLFSIGLYELNLDGTQKLLNGQAIETYNQDNISNFARIYTGWQMATGQFHPGWETKPMEPWGLDPNTFHDYDSKVLLGGEFVPAGLTTREDLETALDNMFAHPNVAPFISKQLIQRFVTSNPSPAYVERVARVFNDNGNGERGDLGAVIKAILLDNDSINSHTNPRGGKAKEPLLRVSQLWRAFNAESPIKYIRFTLTQRVLGQRPLGAKTVFNFYPPDFAPSGAIEDAGLVAPEFKLMADSVNIAYLDKMADLSTSHEFGDPNPLYSGNFNLPMKLDISEATALVGNSEALMDFFNLRLFGGLMSTGLRNIVITHLSNLPNTGDAAQDRKVAVDDALTLLTASPEYSVQR